MTRIGRILLVVLGALAAAPVTVRAADPVVSFAPDDAEMNAAIAKARESLPMFWQQFRDRPAGVDDFCLKVAIWEGDNVEHFWTRDIVLSEGMISAVIDNDPAFVTSVKPGQRIEISEPDISDWMFLRNGKVVGAETLRVMMSRMSPEERAAVPLEYETP